MPREDGGGAAACAQPTAGASPHIESAAHTVAACVLDSARKLQVRSSMA